MEGIMTPIHPICQPIAEEIDILEQEKASLAEELRCAAPNQKPAIANQIKKINNELIKKRKELNKCIIDHPLPRPITSLFTGRATINYLSYLLTTNTPVEMALEFSGVDYTSVELSMPGFVLDGTIKLSSWGLQFTAMLLVSMKNKARGTYNPITHNINIPLTLQITPINISGMLSSWFTFGPSTIQLVPPGLTTESVYSAFYNQQVYGFALVPEKDGAVKFVGAGSANDGFLDGKSIIITEIIGKMNPVP
jgi:hypothetical protein